ncbi:hypothetical protein C8R42DRAFT_709319 [Lentinula raphanica]|nr:hypothetical protein C8R42DRAFT_709319 [Lentinula raphanica]
MMQRHHQPPHFYILEEYKRTYLWHRSYKSYRSTFSSQRSSLLSAAINTIFVLSLSMDKFTRLAIHAGCLISLISQNAGSRISKWRACPVHTSFEGSSFVASEHGESSCDNSQSTLDSLDSMSTPPFQPFAIEEREPDCRNQTQDAFHAVFVYRDKNSKNGDCRSSKPTTKSPSWTFVPQHDDVLEHEDESMPDLIDPFTVTEGNNDRRNIVPASWAAPRSVTDRQPQIQTEYSPWSRSYDREPKWRKKVRKWLMEIESPGVDIEETIR